MPRSVRHLNVEAGLFRVSWATCAVSVAMAFGVAPGHAQTLSCPTIVEVDPATNVVSTTNLASGGACSIRVSGTKVLDITLRIDNPGTLVGKTLSASTGPESSLSPGTWQVPAVATPSRVFRWRGKVESSPIFIDVVVENVRTTISILPLTTATPARSLVILGDDQVRRQGSFLRDSVGVEIKGISDETNCTRQRIAFTPPSGGVVAPDTVVAHWRAASAPIPAGCFAQTRWKLADNVGEQHLRARLVGTGGGRSEEFVTAIGRRKAFLVSGLVAVLNQKRFEGLKVTADTSVVSEEVPDGLGGKTTTTRTVIQNSDPVLDEQNPGVDFDPVLGVSYYLFEKWTGVRAWAAVSLEDIDSRFFYGISLLPVIWQTEAESSIVEIVFGGRIIRRDTAGTEGCKEGVALCSKSSVLFDGPVVGVLVDGTSVLSTIIKAFGM